MEEIYVRGPIICTISVPNNMMEEYEGGICKDKVGMTTLRHIISIVGWDVVGDYLNYWIDCNVWGKYWEVMVSSVSGWTWITSKLRNIEVGMFPS